MSLRNQCLTSLFDLLKSQDTVSKDEALQRLLSDGHGEKTAKKMSTKCFWILRDEEVAVFADAEKKLHKWTGKERPLKKTKTKKVKVVEETPVVIEEESTPEPVIEIEEVVEETPAVETPEVEEVIETPEVEFKTETVTANIGSHSASYEIGRHNDLVQISDSTRTHKFSWPLESDVTQESDRIVLRKMKASDKALATAVFFMSIKTKQSNPMGCFGSQADKLECEGCALKHLCK